MIETDQNYNQSRKQFSWELLEGEKRSILFENEDENKVSPTPQRAITLYFVHKLVPRIANIVVCGLIKAHSEGFREAM